MTAKHSTYWESQTLVSEVAALSRLVVSSGQAENPLMTKFCRDRKRKTDRKWRALCCSVMLSN